MSLPTLEQYNEAAQNPSTAFFDSELQKGIVKTSGLGLPLAACGGFALTYTVSSGSGKYAVRCFHKEARDRERRYDAISKKLATLNSPYFVGFKFQKNGIRVKGNPYPIVKMSWAKGVTIGEFVDSSFRKRESMLALKKSLYDLSIFLEKHHISHGDIQPGNLMVSDDGKSIQLIDYDGMYLPEISSLTSEETGHRNFQHPDRARINPWNERTDRFSFILMSLVMDALAADPHLWIRTRSDGDKFLIGANDFVSLGSSKGFAALSEIPVLKDSVIRFSSICCGDYDAIPTLSDFLNPSFQIRTATSTLVRKVGYISTYPVLDGSDYDLCLKHVGNMVELVGKVVDVAVNKTRWGTPYIFLNFSDWRGKAVKISIWSDYLTKVSHIDFRKLKGKYISVVGLMQPPYVNPRFNYSHLSISLDTTVNEIDEKEAKYRLNYEQNPIPPAEKAQTNREKFDGMKGSASTGQTGEHGGSVQQRISFSGSTSSSTGKPRSNKDILNNIRNRGQSFTGSSSTSHSQSAGATWQGASNTGTKLIPCPYCHTLNSVRPTGVVTVRCQGCASEYMYSHYTGLIEKLVTTSHGQAQGRSNNSTILGNIRNFSSEIGTGSTYSQQPKKPRSGCLGFLISIVWVIGMIWLIF